MNYSREQLYRSFDGQSNMETNFLQDQGTQLILELDLHIVIFH